MRPASRSWKAPPRRIVSLARALSKLGYSSRSVAGELIAAGNVSVNGNVVRNPSFRCDPARDDISVAGKKVAEASLICIVLNKPAGVVTTRSDEKGRATVYDCLGETGQWMFPVGRLDRDTEGLLLMTNDHRLGNRLTDPSSKVPKTYRVELDRPLEEHDREVLRLGMVLDGERLRPAGISASGKRVVECTITEGKNRQIRRMFASLGYTVTGLRRTAIGCFTLGGLKPGEWKNCSADDIRKMLGETGSRPVARKKY
jgi:23S rRNA pseudouridine2605 synthase